LAGVTDPTKALDGSLRNQFLKIKSELGLKSVDQGSNGVHLSAGPLEGMVELQRFFTDHDGKAISFGDTAFGSYLEGHGASAESVTKFGSNPDADKDGKKVSLFDLTEEKSFDEAAKILVGTKL